MACTWKSDDVISKITNQKGIYPSLLYHDFVTRAIVVSGQTTPHEFGWL